MSLNKPVAFAIWLGSWIDKVVLFGTDIWLLVMNGGCNSCQCMFLCRSIKDKHSNEMKKKIHCVLGNGEAYICTSNFFLKMLLLLFFFCKYITLKMYATWQVQSFKKIIQKCYIEPGEKC